MKLISFDSYLLISLSFLITVISKSWVTHHRFFDVCTSLVDNKTYYLVTMNFITSLSILIIIKILKYLLGEIADSQKNKAIEDIQGVFVDLLFSLFMLSKNVEDKKLEN